MSVLQPRSVRIDFSDDADLLAATEGFSCGTNEWDREVDDFICSPRDPDNAFDRIQSGDCRVWL
jgi:hypothetical protein